MFSNGGTAEAPLGRPFNLLWTAVTVSGLGDGMRVVALPLLAARISGDPRDLALVATAEQLPWLLLSLPAGAFADRVDRRRLLATVDLLRTLLAGGFALAVALHAVNVPLLALVGFLLGCGQTCYSAGWTGAVPSVVPPGQRPRANGRLQAAALISNSLLGAPLGTVLFGIAVLVPFGVDALSFAAAALLVLALPRGPRPAAGPAPARRGGPFAGTAEGIRWLYRQPVVRALCLATAAGNLVLGAVVALLVLYARDVLHLGATGFGLLEVCSAVGGVAGSLAAARLGARFGVHRVLVLAPLGAGLFLAGAAATGWWLPAFCCTVGYGALSYLFVITAVSLRQDLVPEHLLSRVGMAYQLVANGAMAVGAALGGQLAHAYGLRMPYLAGAGLVALTGPLLAPVLRRRRPAGGGQTVTGSSRLDRSAAPDVPRTSERTSGTVSTSSESAVITAAQAHSAPSSPSPLASGAAATVPTGASATDPHQS
ncbi:hypothetical protein GCM10009738_82920 [Kitasatospora viridis]